MAILHVENNQSVFNKARKDKFLLVLTLPPILRNVNTPILSRRAQELVQLDTLQFSVWGALVPDVTVPEKELAVYGQHYKVTSQSRNSYPPITVNFNVDNRFGNYWILWKWLEVLNNPTHSGMPSHFSDWNRAENTSETLKAMKKQSQIKEALLSQKQSRIDLENKTAPEDVLSKDQLIHMNNDFLDYQTIITVYSIDEYNTKVARFDYRNAFITNLTGINYNYRDADEVESSFTFAFNQLDITLIGPDTN